MATAGTETNSKPPQVEISAQSAVGVGSTGNPDEEREVSSTENAERKLEVSTDGNKVKTRLGILPPIKKAKMLKMKIVTRQRGVLSQFFFLVYGIGCVVRPQIRS